MPDPLIALFIGTVFILLAVSLFWPKGGLLGLFQRVVQQNDRILREHALKTLFNIERQSDIATSESLVKALELSSKRTSALLKDMQRDGLIVRDGEQIRLSSTGEEYALHIIRAHRLFERYLAEETGHDEAKWHNIADQFEHHLSRDQANTLAQHLGNPTHDPHGDPIPTPDGHMVLHDGQPITTMPLNKPLQIVHLEDEPEPIYAQLVAEGLHPGMEISLLENNSHRVRAWADDGSEHILAPIVANSISVIPLPFQDHEIQSLGEPLNSLKQGQQGQVLLLSPRLRGAERRRMMDLGLLPGTTVTAEMIAPGGDPIAYRIRGALVALRSEQAELIRISDTRESTNGK